MSAMGANDVDLVHASRRGDCQAFGEIVARYQSLICSLAYSATGDLSRSEDLAQETFVTAWRQLGQLRDPSRLRSWLCGIARNLTHSLLRSEGKEPAHGAESLDETAANTPAAGPLPRDQVISREEADLLWRAIEHIPAPYREPLVLFYREHQSIQQVAVGLDLTEDAVRQRLSRGRKMLQDQVAAFVEGALTRTAPNRAFTLGVLAALPVLTTGTTAATLGTATVKTMATVKGATIISIVTAILGPVIGILSAWFGMKASLERAQSERERRCVIRQIWIVISVVAFFGLALGAVILLGHGSWRDHPVFLTWLIVGLCLAYLVWMGAMIFFGQRAIARIRTEEGDLSGTAARQFLPTTSPEPIEFRSNTKLLGLPLIHVRLGSRGGQLPRPALGWIAVGEVAIGVLFGAGGVSVGAISLGGGAVGLLALGGAGIGLFSLSGMAIGVWAIGGVAVGYLACGGAAMGWLAAAGGSAVARGYAIGGMAAASHANDSIAREFIRTDAFLGGAQAMLQSGWFQVVCWLPMLLVVWQIWRMRKARQKTS